MRSKQLLFTGLLCGASLLMGAGTHLNARERGFTPAATPAINTALSFVENIGQVHNQHQQPRLDIDFRLSAGNGLSVFVGSGQIHYQWAKSVDSEQLTMDNGQLIMDSGKLTIDNDERVLSGKDDHTPKTYQMYRMDVTLIGANPDAQVITEGQQAAFERYFQPWVNKSNSNKGVVAHSYGKITYKNVYPNIDWVLYIKNNTVEYDFIVRPGGKVSDIQLQYGGATQLALQADGSLLAATPMGKVAEQAPYSFQEDGETVASGFVLKDNILSFKTGNYSGTLTIDPALEWGTYFGGSDEETGRSIAVDNNGNVYLLGTTGSLSNISTSGAYQTTYGGGNNYNGADAFLSKWDADGNLIWATYYGGSGIDIAFSLACDTANNIYIGGNTKSDSGIATTGSYQDTKAGSHSRSDVFLVKFDTAGQRLWGTYFGGTQDEASIWLALASDRNGHIYMTGDTRSTGGIATTNAYQSDLGGYYDVFLAKFDTSGNLGWSTYYGGDDADYGKGIATDTTGAIYITGQTLSTTGIASTGAYQTTAGGMQDGFLAKFDTAGQLAWGTYIAGSDYDEGLALSTGSGGNIIIAGLTTSEQNIATVNSYQDTAGGMDDVFLASFNDQGQINWCTYYGGAGFDVIGGIWTNTNGDIYIAGQTGSAVGMSTPGVPQDSLIGYQNLFLTRFTETGQMDWGTYYGSTIGEGGGCLSGKDNFVYLSGYSYSAGLATPAAYQTTLGGDDDALLIKFNDCEAPAMPDAILGDTAICSGTEHLYTVEPVPGAASYTYILPSGWSSQGANSSDSVYITPNDANGLLKVVAISACGGLSDTQSLQITVLPSPGPQLVNSNGVLSTTQSYATYQWLLNGGAIAGANAATYLPDENGNYSVEVTNSAGCAGLSDTVSISGLGIAGTNSKTSFKVYPNPAEDYVIIQCPITAQAALWSVDGRLLKDKIVLHEGDNRIVVEDLSAGMYWLKVVTHQGVQVIRLSVKR